jgi:hypothetical protein
VICTCPAGYLPNTSNYHCSRRGWGRGGGGEAGFGGGVGWFTS